MEPLEIVPSEHVAHIAEKYGGKNLDELKALRKELSANKKYRANVGRTSFDLGMKIAEGLFKTMQSIYPKYVQAVGYTVREEKHNRVGDDGAIEVYVVKMYKIAADTDNSFVGVDATEADAVKYLADVAAEDDNLTPEELIRKYQVSEQLFFAKEAVKSAVFHQRTVKYREAKVMATLHTLTIQTVDKLIAELEGAEHRARAERMTKFITPEGRKKLFGF